MTALYKIRQAGFALTLSTDGRLLAAPFSKLTDNQRDYLRQHKTEIIAELAAEAANDSGVQLTVQQNQAITRWVRSLGGSGETIAEELADVLEQCRNNPDALAYLLKRASIEPAKPAKPIGDTRIFCRMCQNHSLVHGRGAQVVRCTIKGVINDDWPRHCRDFAANGKPIPTEGVRWQPECQSEPTPKS
jgi:hypothetical protein